MRFSCLSAGRVNGVRQGSGSRLLPVLLAASWFTCCSRAEIPRQDPVSGNAASTAASKQDEKTDTDKRGDRVKLPMDSETVVFQLEYSGGMPMPLPDGFEPTPRLRVFADGRVITGQSSPRQKVHSFQMNDSELHQWMERVVSEFGFLNIVQEEIAAAVRADPDRMMLMDAPHAELSVQLAEQRHQVKVYAIGYTAGQFPEIESLQRLSRIENMARHLVTVAELGGTAPLTRILEYANQKIADQGFAFRLRAEDLRSVDMQPSRRMGASFHVAGTAAAPADPSVGGQSIPPPDERAAARWLVIVELDGSGDPVDCTVIDSQSGK